MADSDTPHAQYTRKELQAHNTRDHALFVIDNVVYDVTQFLEEHPGGPEVLLDNAGRDASQCFHDVGHSAEARTWMKQFVVGEVVAEDRQPIRKPPPLSAAEIEPFSLTSALSAAAPPLMLAVLAWVLYSYLFP